MALEFGNVSDWVQAISAVLALGASVMINKKSNEFSINRDIQKEIESRKLLLNKGRIFLNVIIENMKQRLSYLNLLAESNPYTVVPGIDDPKLFRLCENSINKLLDGCDSIEITQLLIETSQCIDHIRDDITDGKSISLTIGSLNSWIGTLEEKHEKLCVLSNLTVTHQ